MYLAHTQRLQTTYHRLNVHSVQRSGNFIGCTNWTVSNSQASTISRVHSIKEIQYPLSSGGANR